MQGIRRLQCGLRETQSSGLPRVPKGRQCGPTTLYHDLRCRGMIEAIGVFRIADLHSNIHARHRTADDP
jgi:hypothetical protein